MMHPGSAARTTGVISPSSATARMGARFRRIIDDRPEWLASGWVQARPRLAAFSGWLLAFVAILAVKWWTLKVPASFDASWSVFAGGSTLAHNGFDLGELIRSPGYWEYGPGSHAASPVTWLTGAVIWLIGDGARLLPVLHAIHFMIGAIALQQIYRYARGIWTVGGSLLAVLVVAAIPTFNAQLGFMYLEIPQL